MERVGWRKREVMAGLLAAVAMAAILGLAMVWSGGRRPPGVISQTPGGQQAEEVVTPAGRPSPLGPVIAKAEPETPAEAPTTDEAQAEARSATSPVAPPRSDPRSGWQATVLVRTSPPGANVVFDNSQRLACTSPCSISLPQGRHTAAAVMPGYGSALRIFQLPEEADLFLRLAPMSGQVQVLSAPRGASILIDGQPRRETTPATLELPTGKHTVAVFMQGYRRAEQEIEVKDSAFLKLEFTLGK